MFLESFKTITNLLNITTSKIDPQTGRVISNTNNQNPLPEIKFVKKSDYIKEKYSADELDVGQDDRDKEKYIAAKTEARKEIKARYDSIKKAFDIALADALETNTDQLPTVKEINDAIVDADKYIDNHPELKEKNFSKANKSDFSLDPSKVSQREQNQTMAKEMLTKNMSLSAIGNKLLEDILPPAAREAHAFIMCDVHSIDELLDDVDVIKYGTEKEKEKLVARKFDSVKRCMMDLSELKDNEKAYLDYIKDNYGTIQYLGETDNSKVSIACNSLGLPTPVGKQKEFIAEYGMAGPSFSTILNLVGKCINPYYTKLDDEVYKGIINISEGAISDYFENVGKHESIYYSVIKNLDQAKKTGKLCIDFFVGYGSDVSFNDAKVYVPDYLKMYFMKNNNIAKAVDEKGNVILNNKDMYANMAKGLIEGKTYVLYDENGNYFTKMNLQDPSKSSALSVSNKALDNINFKLDPKTTFKSLKEDIKNLDGIFSKNHKEFTDIKKFVNSMDKAYSKGITQAMLCEELRKLASKYVESKAINCKYGKTNRTYKREEYFTKLINSIDKSYPKQQAQKEPTMRIENLNKVNQNEAEFLGKIIEMNKTQDPMDVEKKVEEMLHTEKRTQITVDTKENVENNLKESIIEDDIQPNHEIQKDLGE